MTTRKATRKAPAKPAGKASRSKAPTKAKKPAPKPPATTPVPATEAAPVDWPPGLNSEKGDALFEQLEAGVPKSRAPEKVGLAWRTVFRWMKQHPKFAERVEEAVAIGCQSIVDGWVDISHTATDKDSAAAARAKVDIQDKYLQRTAPQRYNIRLLQHSLAPAKPGTPGQGGAIAIVGVVVVPAKVSGRGVEPTDVIDGVGRVIVPSKQLTAPREAEA